MEHMIDSRYGRLSRLSHFIIAAIMICIAGPFGWFMFDRESPVAIIEQTDLTSTVPAGSYLEYKQVILRDRLCDTTITRRLIDGAGVLHQFEPVHSATGGSLAWPDPETRIIRVQIPDNTNPGDATLQVSASFKCNPIHNFWPINVQLPDHRFTITRNPADAQLRMLQQQGILQALPEVVQEAEILPRTNDLGAD